jgi:hypothetical protein
MAFEEVAPLNRYLKELRHELKRHQVAAADDALSDASEFLQSELARLGTRTRHYSCEQLYKQFVKVYGSPADIAFAYIDTPRSANRPCLFFNTLRLTGLPRIAAALVLLASTVGLCVAGLLQEPPKLSPFTEVRHDGERIIVRVRGELYELIALDDIAVARILQSAKDQFGELWQKRFAEDLVEVLWGMGHRPGATVKLSLRNLQSSEPLTIADAAMTEANRSQVWDRRRNEPSRKISEKISPEQARAVVDEFQTILQERWSYYSYSAGEIEPAIASLAERIDEFSTTSALALELQKIVALGIDGHAEVRGWRLAGGFLPFLIEPSGDRFIAFKPTRDQFVVDGFPFIISVDGRPFADWCNAAESLVPKGSPGYIRRHALRQLRNIEYWRGELGLPQGPPLQVELASLDGTASKTISVPIIDNQQLYGVWPKLRSRVLPEDVGYLRLEAMDDAAVAAIIENMPRFRGANGMVVDVRDNGGGSREPLRWLYSYLAPEENPPRVANCARYRLFAGFGDDHLTSRFLYPADSSTWNERERTAIAEFQKSFRPEWQPPDDEFSPWHYMVLSRLDDPRIFHFSKPVVILMNEKCFSATDVFLAALKGMPNVTLVGTTSGGGSARAETVRLNNAPISLRLGSMVSFMRNGQLFDGRGVQPDIVIHPEPDYFIGRSDNALTEAAKIASTGKQ